MSEEKRSEIMDAVIEFGSLKFQKGMSVYDSDEKFKELDKKVTASLIKIFNLLRRNENA